MMTYPSGSNLPCDSLLVGTWSLTSWTRLTEGESPFHPFGTDAVGLLIYAADGAMAVQMTAGHRIKLGIGDPIGGPVEARAAAYSSCLAYFGTYRVEGSTVVHRIEASLFPDWTGAEQARPFTLEGDALVLRTPPQGNPGHITVNEMAWVRRVP